MNYYDYGYGYATEQTADVAGSVVGGIFASMGISLLISGAIGIFMLVAMWKLFKKAGKNGWEALIPIYNIIVMLEITELPVWYIILFIVPIANIYVLFKIYIELAHKFGQSTGFGIAMVFFSVICIPILAFGSATYQGKPSSVENTTLNQGIAEQPMAYSNPVPQQNVAPVVPEQPMQQAQFITEPGSPMPVQPEVQQPTNIFENPVQQTTLEPVAPVEPVIPVEPVAPVAPVSSVEPQVNVTPNPTPTVTDIPQVNNQQPKFCPNCGNQSAANAETCFMCGHKF